MLSNLKIGHRLKMGFGVLMLGMASMGAMSIYDFNITANDIKNNLTVTVNKLNEVKKLESHTLVSGYTAIAANKVAQQSDAQRFKSVYTSNATVIKSAEENLKKFSKESSIKGEEELLRKFFQQREMITKMFAQVFQLQAEGKSEESSKIIDQQILPAWDEYKKIMGETVSFYDKEINSTTNKILTDTERSRNFLIGIFFIFIILGGIISIMLTNGIINPLHRALDISKDIADGKFYQKNLNFNHSKDEIGELLTAIALMQKNLTETITQIRESAEQVHNASFEMNERNIDLSARTEQQASSLEETAATIEELSSGINQNAIYSNDAATLSKKMNEEAIEGSSLVQKVVTQMSAIKNSSDKISQITAVIDGIAFQTNILALNAAVEAARAGEHGRGFAVVASEVRTLSQRSAQAAKEIKALIEESSLNVSQGSNFANNVSNKITDISNGFKAVTELISQINTSIQEQNYGVKQIHEAISHIDSVTQQNAALVEESAVVSNNLSQQGNDLTQIINKFKII